MTTNNDQKPATRRGLTTGKLLVVLTLMAAAFLAAFNIAQGAGDTAAASALGSSGSSLLTASSGGGGCCGGGGAPVEGTATVEGDVQKVSVDTSSGTFNPNVVKVKAGIPVEIAFSQSSGGCLSGVDFPDFGISEDLTAGGKTVKLPALEKGTYQFFCQMGMVSAQIVAE